MREQNIYLSRPFTGCIINTILDYYNQVSNELKNLGHNPIIPFTNDFRIFKNRNGVIQVNEGIDPVSHNTNKGIVRRDYFLLSQSDMIISNFSLTKTPSIGVVTELAWAYQLKKHTIVIKKKNAFNSPFIDQCADIIVNDMEECFDYLNIMTLKV